MNSGYTGKMVIIDLSEHTITTKTTNMKAANQFIGGKGLGAKLLFDNLPIGTPALSPENILMFATGPLTGTPAQTSGRGVVITKSPQTNLFLDSHFGGYLAVEIKKAGWDFIIINRKSKNPVYININNDTVEFKNASEIWNKECLETHNWLQKTEGRVKTAVIGPACR